MRLGLRTFAAAIAIALIPAASASAADYAATARNIVPSGQFGTVPIPDGAERQAEMYDGLTPLFSNVSDADIATYFKSEALGSLGGDGPGTVETVPRPGVEIVRDSYNVPHVTAATYDDGIWASGWIAATDRGLLLEQARFNARVSAIDAPGLSGIGLVVGLESFTPSAETEAEVAKQTEVLQSAGAEGQQVLHDIDTFIQGINDQRAATGQNIEPWTRNDVYALNALKGQFLGEGGGDEARRTQFYARLREDLGKKTGKRVFHDVRQFKNPETHFAVDGEADYGKIPRKPKGNVIIKPGSLEETPAVPEETAERTARSAATTPENASNVLMVDGARSVTGNPLMVGGPQIGYFYPGLTWEIDMNAPGLQWRGVTSAPFPGYLLIGRGEDFATTLTSASADIIDQFANEVCGKRKYVYKGKCTRMEQFDAGVLAGQGDDPDIPVEFDTTVHGPVTGYAKKGKTKYVISSKRSSYGRDVLDQLFFRRLSTGEVSSPESFMEAARLTPQTFNSFYIDHQNIAEYTSGLLPERSGKVDPGLLTNGEGKYDWKGTAPDSAHPQGTNPADGTIVNWNESAARGFAAADDQFGRNGSVMRVDLLTDNMEALANNGQWSLTSLTGAMNAGATQDVRAMRTVPLLEQLLQGSKAPNAQAQAMLDQMVAWNQAGGSRLDVDLNGEIDHPGAASMDAAWPRIANAFMEPVLKKNRLLNELDSLFSRYDEPPGGQYSGWHQYFDRDVRELLGEDVADPFRNAYCGGGKRKACRKDVWAAIADAGEALEESQGSPDPAAWHANATEERISFAPGLLPTTMRYTNRPSGIQQVISFNGHR